MEPTVLIIGLGIIGLVVVVVLVAVIASRRPISDAATLRNVLDQAETRLDRGERGAARSRFRRIVRSAGNFAQEASLRESFGRAHVGLARIAEQEGALAEALTEYRGAFGLIGLPDEVSVRLSTDIAARNDRSPQSIDILLDHLSRDVTGPTREVVAEFLRSLVLVPRAASPGDHSIAEILAGRVLEVAPLFGWAERAKGVAAAGLGRPDEAIAHLMRAEELEPSEPAAPLELGIVLRSVGRLDLAADAVRRSIRLTPTDAEPRVRLAEILVAAANAGGGADAFLDEATSSLTAACEADPARADAWHLLGTIQWTRGQLETAMQTLARAAWLQPTHGDYHLDVARLAFQLGDLLVAATEAARTLELENTRPDAALLLGQVNLRRSDLVGAEAAFRRVDELDPGNPEGLRGLGIALFGFDRYTEAAATLGRIKTPTLADTVLRARAISRGVSRADALVLLEECASRGTESAELWFRLGCERAAQAQWSTATDAFAHVGLADGDPEMAQDACLFRAACLLRDGQPDGAAAILSDSAPQSLNDPRHYYLNALIAIDRGERAAAADAFRRTIDLDARYVAAWLGLGLTSRRDGDFAAARESYAMAVDLEPDNADAVARLALCQLLTGDPHTSFSTASGVAVRSLVGAYVAGRAAAELGEYDRAAELWDALGQALPADEAITANVAKALYLAGWQASDGGDFDAAIAKFSRSRALHPEPAAEMALVEALVRKGTVALARADPQGLEVATASFTAAAEVDGSDRRTRDYLGLVNLLRGGGQEAVALLAEPASGFPSERRAFLLGLALLEAGDPGAAAAALRGARLDTAVPRASRAIAAATAHAKRGYWLATARSLAEALVAGGSGTGEGRS